MDNAERNLHLPKCGIWNDALWEFVYFYGCECPGNPGVGNPELRETAQNPSEKAAE